jgi:hypothetical protein
MTQTNTPFPGGYVPNWLEIKAATGWTTQESKDWLYRFREMDKEAALLELQARLREVIG